MRSCFALALALTAPALGCGDEQCLVFDYAPPSALFTVTNRATGEPLCELALKLADGRPVIAHPARCEYELADWADPELGQTLVLRAPGFADETVSLPAPARDGCDQVIAPDTQQFQMTAQDTAAT
jgi:hypothetical protein